MKATHLPKRADTIRIFIVEDHPVFQEGLARLVGQETDLVVCGTAASARQALADIERLKPQLSLVDIGLPGQSGLELIKNLRSICPEMSVLVISMHDETLYAERVLHAGGQGYIMKQEGPEKILAAIRQILNGQIYLSRKMSARMLDAFAGRRSKASSPISGLSDREIEVLRLIGEGMNTRTIAKALHLSPKTVDAHRGNIKEKLELKNGTELVVYAARWLEAQSSAL